MKKSVNRKHINILLAVLLAVCLVFAGTVLGKYIVEKTLDDRLNLTIAGTPKGNVLIGDGEYGYDDNSNFVPTAGFAYQLKTMMESNSKTLGDVTKIVFDTEVPLGIDKTVEAAKIDVSHGGNGRIFAYYDGENTVYVVPEELPTDGESYPMMAHENATAMFAGLHNLKTIEGLEEVYLDNITDANNMFLECSALTAVDLSHWIAENLTNMQYMFAYCASLKSLDLTSFHTVNVSNMAGTFNNCAALETIELDKEKFVTDQVEDMGYMFGECNSLKAIDVSGFNTENVTNMYCMFAGCHSLETLDVSGFDTSSVDTMFGMFQSCYLLETIDVSGFDTDLVTDLSDMFLDCDALKTLDLSSWDTSNVTTMWRMFNGCESLEKLDLSTFKTGNVTDMSSMFSGCTSLNKLYLTGWNTENVTNMYGMFQNCRELTVLDLSSFNTSNVTIMRYMFAYCDALQTIYVSNDWSTEKVVNTEDNGDDYTDDFEAAGNDLFTDCWSLVGGQGTSYYDIIDEDSENYNNKKYAVIDKAMEEGGAEGYLTLYEAYTLAAGMEFNLAISDLQMLNFDATTITFGSYNMLKYWGEIGEIWNDETVSYVPVDDKGQGTIRAYVITNDYGTGIYVVSKDSSMIFANQDCSFMFDWMQWLTSISGLDQVDTRNTTNMSFMFNDCWLTDLDVSGFDTGKVTDMTGMFNACLELSWLNVSDFDTSNVTTMQGMFANCSALYDLDVSGFDISKVMNTRSMFAGCSGLSDLDLSSWNTGNVANMMSMFADCTDLETIYAGEGWTTANVTEDEGMFTNCPALVGGQGTSWTDMKEEDSEHYLDKTYALIDAAREPNGKKGYLTDADYGTKSKILLPGGEFNAELAKLLADNEDVTKVQFSHIYDIYDFSEIFGFDYWEDEAWETNADAVLDVARSGNISAFVVGDTVYIVAKETDYDDQYNSVIYANADCEGMFRHNVGDETGYIPAGRLTAIDGLSFVDTSNTTDMSSMFRGSSNLATVDLRGFNTADVTNMEYMFYGCNSLGGISLSGFDTGKVTDMSYMFYDCDAITALKLSDWDVSGVTNMNGMFTDCDALETLNLTGWNTKNVTDMTAMFSGNSALKTIYVDESWKTGRVESSEDMFKDCNAIVGGQETTFDWMFIDKTYARIDRAESDGIKGYLTYEEAYTLVSGPVFNDILYQKDKTAIYKIIFGTFDQYKEELGITWESMEDETGLSYFDQEKEGNIRLHIVDGTRITEEYGTLEKIYYILSKDSSKIIANEDCSIMFLNDWTYTYRDTGYLEEIAGLELIDTRYVTDMSYMFDDCNVTTLNFSNFVTSNVTNMSGMFYECSFLTSLDLSGFDTSNVTDMSGMFDTCSALETLDVSKFVTDKVTDMSRMFNGMSNLKALNVLNFDTSMVTDMSHMFSSLYYLDVLDISNFSTAGYPYIDGMFNSCENLTTIYASEFWDPDKVKTDEYGWDVFTGSTNLIGGEGSTYDETAGDDQDNDYKYARIDTKVSAGVPGLFADKNTPPMGEFTLKTGSEFNSVVSGLIDDFNATKLLFGSWAQYGKANGFDWYGDTTAVTLDVDNKGIKAFVKGDTIYILSAGTMYANENSSNMFKHSFGTDTGYIPQGALTAIEGLDAVDTSNVTNMSHMFEYCINLAALDVTSFDTSKVTDMSWMFRDCAALTELNVSNFNTSKVENMQEMFRYVNSLKTLDLSSEKFNTANVTNMIGMFRSSSGLQTLDLSKLETGAVTDMSYMFEGCSGLTSLNVSFDTSSVTDMSHMFDHCEALQSLDVSSFNTSNVTTMEAMFNCMYNLTELKGLTGFNTANVTTMWEIFSNCRSITYLDLSSFDTSNVTHMTSMFYSNRKLKTIYVEDLWDIGNLTEYNSSHFMFFECYELVGGAGTSYSEHRDRDATYAHIDGGTADPGYLTGPSATLTTGTKFNAAVNTLFSSTVTKLQFGTYNDYADKVGNWDDSQTFVDVDNDGDGYADGLIRVFTPAGSDTVYVLSEGISQIYANADSSYMIAGYANDEYNSIQNNLITISGFNNVNMSKVTNLSRVFLRAEALQSVDVDMWDTSSVKNMNRTFMHCGALKSLDISKWSTGNVTDMYATFYNCSTLTELNVSSWITTNVGDMGFMFHGCKGLTTLDVAKWSTTGVTNMEYMFAGCSALTSLGLSNFETDEVTLMDGMFSGCSMLSSVDVSGFDTSMVTDMSYMFNNCQNLTTLDVSNWNTSKVTNMSYIFYDCKALTTLDVLKWNTSEVTDMKFMFRGCEKLITLDVSNWDTGNVTYMNGMFAFCRALTTLDLSNWNTGKVTTMQSMFTTCGKLSSVNVSGFDTSKVTNMGYMFESCTSLTSIDLSSFNTSKVSDMSAMFWNCGVLETIYVSELWNVSAVTNSGSMFQYCSKLVGGQGTKYNASYVTRSRAIIDGGTSNPGYLTDKYTPPTGDFTLMTGTDFNGVVRGLISTSGATNIRFGSWETYGKTNGFIWSDGTNVGETANTIKAFENESDNTIYILSGGDIFANTDSSYMFSRMTGIKTISGLDKVNTSKVTNMSYMFESCSTLTSLDITKFVTSSVTDMNHMFYQCSALASLDVTKFVTSSVTDMSYMFYQCSTLTSLNVSNFVTTKVTDMNHMFYDCINLASLDVAKFVTNSVDDMSYMFSGCRTLTSLNVSGFKTVNVTSMNGMFLDCPNLKSLDVSNFDTSKVEDMYAMFAQCNSLTTLDLSGFDTGKVKWMGSMFAYSDALTSLDLSKFDTSSATDMNSMFKGCTALISLDLSGFKTGKVTDMSFMFDGCSKLTYLELSSFNTGNVTDMTQMFGGCEALVAITVSADTWTVENVPSDDGEGMFSDCSNLKGGKGTTLASTGGVVDKTYATIDGGTTNPGYLTDINTVTLITGSDFNSKIRNLFSVSVTKLQFGSFTTYGKANGLNWDNYIAIVDSANAGTIRVFRSGDTVYVLSEGSNQIYANANSAKMFTGVGTDAEPTSYSVTNTLCSYLKEIKGLDAVNTSNVTNMTEMFYRLQVLSFVDVSGFDTSNVTRMDRMFTYGNALTSLDVSKWDTGSLVNMAFMFTSCTNLTTLDVSNWNLSNVTSTTRLFYNCYKLTTLNFSTKGMGKVIDMSEIFYDCYSLTSLNISKWNTSSVTNMSSMFSGCSRLTTIYVGESWVTTGVTSSNNMFFGCTALKGGNGTGYNASYVDKTYARIDKAGQPGYFTQK